MKSFIITVDTEGDNLWNWKPGNKITTENSKYIPRFQELCEKYGFKPVYLTNYEMAMDDGWVQYASQKAKEDKCEIGMHLHAWNSPPGYELKQKHKGNPYITEYPAEVIREKHKYLKELIVKRFGVTPVTYRAGRWATNEVLMQMLEELGFLVDCSVTPQISHSQNPGCTVPGGSNYSKSPMDAYMLGKHLMEVPMTTRCKRSFQGHSFRSRVRNLLKGRAVWLRPVIQTVDEMKQLMQECEKDGIDYVEFMIHSSELMAGGSPYGKTENEVEGCYQRMEEVFAYANKQAYKGISLRDYYDSHVSLMVQK